VAFIVVGHRSAASLLHGKPRLGTVERLDLALFVDTQNERFVGRVQVQSHHVHELLGEPRVVAELELAHEVRLDSVGRPSSLNGRLTDLRCLGHRVGAPMGPLLRLDFAGKRDYRLDPLGGNRFRAPGARTVSHEARHSFFQIPVPPPVNHRPMDAQTLRGLLGSLAPV